MRKLSLYLFLSLGLLVHVSAQQKTSAAQLVEKITAFHESIPTEKIYISFDKNQYFVGDTIWFKTYLVDANNITNAKSGKVYVELLNDSSRVIERLVIPIGSGTGWGDFTLKNNYEQGSYFIRAYTNFQQNFGDTYFFTRNFTIGSTDEKNWLMNATQKLTSNGALSGISFTAKLSDYKNQAIGLKDVEINLMNGKNLVTSVQMQTSLDGLLHREFNVSKDKLGENVYIVIQNKLDKSQKLILPIQLGEGKIDLQFMPEGGPLIVDQRSRIAFKAVDQDGIGTVVSGEIYNQKGEEIVAFKSTHKGMGSFLFFPNADDIYTAKVKLSTGLEQTFTLPLAKKSGTTLRIDNVSQPDTILLYIRASSDLRINESYSLLAQTGSRTVYAANVNLKNGFYNLKLAKNAFSSGITHFTLFSPSGIPINERLIMTGDLSHIALDVSTEKSEYSVMDSINIHLKLSDKQGDFIPKGNFVVKVTDDNVAKDENNAPNILGYYLLTSNLKGNIEDPNWYFQNQSRKTQDALDHLLLTQGWIGYDWDQILTRENKLKYKFEAADMINGRLTNLWNNPVPNLAVSLLSTGKELAYMNTVSLADGSFSFNEIPLIDSVVYLIKIKTPKGKSSAAKIIVDEFEPTNLKVVTSKFQRPWYFNTDSTLLNYNNSIKRLQKEVLAIHPEGISLKGVVITGKTVYKPNTNAWNANLIKQITEEELKKTPRETLYQLLNAKVPGFSTGTGFHYIGSPKYGKIVNVIVDSISTFVASGGDFDAYNTFFFNYVKAEDVKDIKVFRSPDYAVISIITRSGSGPFVKRSVGNYVYRPLSVHIPRKFYSPKYTTIQSTNIADYRTTIFWEPNLVVDEKGEANVSFYAAKKPSIYTVTVEGTDLNGNFVFKQEKIKINPRPIAP